MAVRKACCFRKLWAAFDTIHWFCTGRLVRDEKLGCWFLNLFEGEE